ncbi:AAA family ATPase [Kineosporia sp. J2-2]|uniref:AAA family ATPase n=1 Tax=Kineosporia corallincola TaxID=2835133 RepID=A0ABS5TEC9_9ACTN|nr:NB-ARC domain-containing protein [Kineosporia corallincola]MBT0769437.1 AAA family ATPase [Kineosporia corallincola]
MSATGPHDDADQENQVEAGRLDDLVQARDVSGGIHFYGRPARRADGSTVPRQLPGDVGVFVNRLGELASLGELAAAHAAHAAHTAHTASGTGASTVIVVTGSAGVGKTALALHFGHRVEELFPDGQIYYDLRGYGESRPLEVADLLDRVLRDLGLPADRIPADLQERSALLRSLLARRRVLVVLDNAASAAQVRPLIPGTVGSLLLVTSRSALPALAVRDGARRVHVDVLSDRDAVDLLTRVTTAGHRRDDERSLAELARLCANLPLALRIAAERASARPTMELGELIGDLRDSTSLWDALSIGDEGEEEAVRAVFAWSYRALTPQAAGLFRALGVYPGTDIALMPAAVLLGETVTRTRRALDLLLGACLLSSPHPGRFRCHDLLRAYAVDQAREAESEAERTRMLERLVRWFTLTVDQAALVLAPGDRFPLTPGTPGTVEPLSFASPVTALEWFETERDNLIACCTAAFAAGLALTAWELAMTAGALHASHFMFADWEVMSRTAVAAAETLREPGRLGQALDNRGKYLFRTRQLEPARAVHERALAVREATGDRPGQGESLNALGLIGLRTRDLDAARQSFARAATMFAAAGDERWVGIMTSNAAESELEAMDPDAPDRAGAAALVAGLSDLPGTFARLGDPGLRGNALWLLAWAQRLAGDLPAARASVDEALGIAEDVGSRAWEGFWLLESGRVHLAAGELPQALQCCAASASLQRQLADRSREAMAVALNGEVLAAAGGGDPAEALAFLRQAARMHRDLGDDWNEALALVRAAEVAPAPDAAEEEASRALRLAGPFADARAQALRRRARALADPA